MGWSVVGHYEFFSVNSCLFVLGSTMVGVSGDFRFAVSHVA